MNEDTATKQKREVIPNLLSVIAQSESVLEEIQSSIRRLDESLDGMKPEQEDSVVRDHEVEPDPRPLSDIQLLEKNASRLLNDLRGATKELRIKLNLLLGT